MWFGTNTNTIVSRCRRRNEHGPGGGPGRGHRATGGGARVRGGHSAGFRRLRRRVVPRVSLSRGARCRRWTRDTWRRTPPRFVPGQRYKVTIVLARTGIERTGFQLAVRFKDSRPGRNPRARSRRRWTGRRLGSPGRRFGPTRTEAGGLIGSARAMSRGGRFDGSRRRAAPVLLHVSANAADGNESADGWANRGRRNPRRRLRKPNHCLAEPTISLHRQQQIAS